MNGIKFFGTIKNEIIDLVRFYIKARYVKGAGPQLISAGLFLLTLCVGINFAGWLNIQTSWIDFNGSISSAETPKILLYFGLLLILIGSFWILRMEHNLHKQTKIENDRKVALVVQIDAYSNVVTTPLKSSLPEDIKGKPISIIIEKRDALIGGNNLQEVSDEIINIEQMLKQHARGHDLADISISAGGLAPVPFLFLLGNVLEDERPINWAEWNRVDRRWTWSSEGESINLWGLPAATNLTSDEVVLKSGITYPILDIDISTAFPNLSVLEWEPSDKIFQRIVNEQSCNDICNEFKSLMVRLKGQGVRRVHFLLACSSALTMRLGSVLCPRNMPETIIYQYEKNSELIYTWGLVIKVNEGKKSVFVIDRRSIR